jgi:hypothetical protein
MKRRFKTEREFEIEFGENWRNKVPSGFPDSMDCLLGQPYPNLKSSNFIISREMLTFSEREEFRYFPKPKPEIAYLLLTYNGEYMEYVNLANRKTITIKSFNSPTDNCQIQAMELGELFDIETDARAIKALLHDIKDKFCSKNLSLIQTTINHKPMVEQLSPKVVFEMGNKIIALISL